MSISNTPVNEHFQRLLRLLDLEAEAEKQEVLDDLQRRSPASAEASGATLINLVIRDETAGLGGRILLTLGKRNQSLPLLVIWVATFIAIGLGKIFLYRNITGAQV